MQLEQTDTAAAGGGAETRMRLDQLGPHCFGIIEHIEASDDDSERLMSMGVCTGRTVELIKTGDPLILRVFATRIGLSARLATRVYVRPLTGIIKGRDA